MADTDDLFDSDYDATQRASLEWTRKQQRGDVETDEKPKTVKPKAAASRTSKKK